MINLHIKTKAELEAFREKALKKGYTLLCVDGDKLPANVVLIDQKTGEPVDIEYELECLNTGAAAFGGNVGDKAITPEGYLVTIVARVENPRGWLVNRMLDTAYVDVDGEEVDRMTTRSRETYFEPVLFSPGEYMVYRIDKDTYLSLRKAEHNKLCKQRDAAWAELKALREEIEKVRIENGL